MPRYRLLIEYDGAAFAGWQHQPDQRTVQLALEEALAVALRQSAGITGSGRTDAGVHATGQVAHFDGPEGVDTHRLRRSLNGILRRSDGGSVVVLGAERAPDTFHARYDARLRVYHYLVSCEPRALERNLRLELRPAPDFPLMNEAAAVLLGRHDFDSFCITQSATSNRICTVEHARWDTEERADDWRFVIAADRFLHGMVRAIVGTLLMIGMGRLPSDALPDILAARDRRAAAAAAPAHGLRLAEVHYPDGAFGGRHRYSAVSSAPP